MHTERTCVALGSIDGLFSVQWFITFLLLI